MTAQQDGNVVVTDLVSGKMVPMSKIDAVLATRNFPQRYIFSSPDPQFVASTLSAFFTADSLLAIPVVTGAKGGNPALASLITTLAQLGLIVDQTT